jgi:hypothetical protein
MFMTRRLVPLTTPDLSAFAKTLKKLLDERHAAGKSLPTHVELLNLLARAAGQRNFATLKAIPPATPLPPAFDTPSPSQIQESPPALVEGSSSLSTTARKALMQFDESRQLVRLPTKRSVLEMTMWALWTQFAARRTYTEKEVNALLNAHHLFGDPATLRREMVGMKLMDRKSDCSAYWKEPRRPEPEVLGFLQAWRAGLR